VASLAGEARILDAFGPGVVAELRVGRTLVVEDCLTDPRTLDEAYAPTWASIGCRSLIVTPLILDGRRIVRAVTSLLRHRRGEILRCEASDP
jgi:GAF domain-containing protein